MKVIDLLNKIAKGEEVPKKIKYCGVYYYWTGFNYENSEADDVLFWAYIYSEKHLNDEIEIYINGEKIELFDYEPLKQGEYFYKENGKWYVQKLKNVSKIIEEDKKIEKLEYWVEIPYTKDGEYLKQGLQEQAKFNENIYLKINEIIDKLNKEE